MRWIFATSLLAVSIQAHPGHGPLSEGSAHFFTSPYHLAAALLVAGGIGFAASCVKARTAKIILRTAGALVALGSLALWGFGA